MLRHLVAAAAAAGLALASTAALADDITGSSDDGTTSQELFNPFSDSIVPFATTLSPQSAQFDLGVDVSDVPVTPDGVSRFLASLAPDGQQILINSCQHYLTSPSSAQSEYTLSFCRVLING